MYKLFIYCLQDENSLFPQNYAMNINGYVLVFSVNSKKRLVRFPAAVYGVIRRAYLSKYGFKYDLNCINYGIVE